MFQRVYTFIISLIFNHSLLLHVTHLNIDSQDGGPIQLWLTFLHYVYPYSLIDCNILLMALLPN